MTAALARTRTRWHALAALGAVALGAASGGCGNVRAIRPAVRNVAVDRFERLEAVRPAGPETEETLLRLGLPDAARDDPSAAAQALAYRLERAGSVAPSDVVSLGELCYRAGLSQARSEPEAALIHFRDAAVLAALALAEPGLTRPEAALELHNRAVGRLVRGSQRGTSRSWQDALSSAGLTPTGSSVYLDPTQFHTLQVVDDLWISGMQHRYRNCGLGVPLVAHRNVATEPSDPQDCYYPRRLRAAATALVVPGGGLAGGAWRRQPAALMLYDPFDVRHVPTGSTLTPLAGDRTAPLAVQVADRNLRALELTGLFESQFRDGLESGLFMLRPYEPGKIPVVLIHGLVSSPRAWAQTINELRNDPELSRRYQVWVYLYATGQPIPRSALQLRRALVEARQTFDPGQTDASLDRMVLVGHSMGGLLTKMMVQDTGLTLWDASIRVPHGQLKGPAQVLAELDEMLVLRPLPFVQRVVFVATPHRGSRLANDLLGRVVSDFVRRPDGQRARIEELERLNGPDLLTRELRGGRTLTSVGNLRTDSPILSALDRVPIRQTVPYHSIIPQVSGTEGSTDTVVGYSSSHLPGAESELIFPGTHFSQQDPRATDELKRILTLHLEGP
jgi:pimeloyl-ACP methyl ester carboxylesterase